jgi:predicted deacylase
MAGTGITTDIDLDRDGRAYGYLRVPASTERAPFGWIPTPIVSIKNGNGPCVVLIGGCHGDEYEGQVLAAKLASTLKPDEIRGQVVILPAANAAAVEAGRRYSPIDEGNLNRAFPGSAQSTPTGMVAHYIEGTLLPRADLVIDIHSGGNSVEYTPSAMVSHLVERDRMARLIELVRVFGLPISFVVDHADDAPSSVLGACDRAGVFNISAELAGGGSMSMKAVQAAEAGIYRLLHHLGILVKGAANAPPPVTLYQRLPVASTVFAQTSGLFEPCVNIGEQVHVGQLAGRIHPIETPWLTADEVTFPASGIVLCRRVPARTRRGDGLFKLGIRWTP